MQASHHLALSSAFGSRLRDRLLVPRQHARVTQPIRQSQACQASGQTGACRTTYMYVLCCVCVCVCVCMYIYTYICIYIYVYIYVYIYIHMYIYLYLYFLHFFSMAAAFKCAAGLLYQYKSTCCTSTKVQILTFLVAASERFVHADPSQRARAPHCPHAHLFQLLHVNRCSVYLLSWYKSTALLCAVLWRCSSAWLIGPRLQLLLHFMPS